MITDDEIHFSSGRKLYANRGIIGIAPGLEISGGYDQEITWPIPDWWPPEDRKHLPTEADMIELADLMIATWTAFKSMIPE